MPNHADPVAHPAAAPANAPARRLTGLWPPTLAWLAAASMLVLLAAALVWQVRVHQHGQAVATAHNLARQLDAQAAAALMQADLLLQTVALMGRDATAHEAADTAPAALRALAATAPDLLQWRLADADGRWRLWLPTDAAGPPGHAAEREEFQRARADSHGGLIVTGPLRHHAGGHWLLVLSRAMHGADGRFAGLASVDLPVARFDALFSAIDVGELGTVTLRTDTLALVYRRPWPQAGQAAVGRSDAPPALREALASNPLAGDFDDAAAPHGVARVNVYRKLQDYPLLLQLDVSQDEFLRRWTALETTLLALAAAALGLMLLATWQQHRAHRRDLARTLAESLTNALAEPPRQWAWHDALTALPSRALLLDRLTHAQQTSRRLGTHAALLVLALAPAEPQGDPQHPAGNDPQRVRLAQRLLAAMRATDTVARLGDDHFVLLCEHLGADAALATAQLAALDAKITAALARPEPQPGHTRLGPVAIGHRLFKGSADSPEQLLADAEAAARRHHPQQRQPGAFYDDEPDED